jgi:hypothetical protein
MSIILEALRKAEASRREPDRSALATPSSPHVPLRSRVPLWLLPVGAAAVVSVSIGAWLLWPKSSDRTAAARATPPPAASVAAEHRGAANTLPALAETSSQSTAPAASGTPTPASEPSAATAAASPPARNGADVRSLALEARGAPANASSQEGAAPAATEGRTLKRGSVEVRDLMSAQAATAPTRPAVKPGTVEVRDLLAEDGAASADPQNATTQPAPTGSGPDASASPAANGAPATGVEPARQAPASPATPPPKPAVPLIDELVANGELNPPDLSLEMHAYGPDPASRFVYINMRRYHIGDTTREGAVIEDITPQGAVLLLQGRRFLLESH